MKGEGLKRGYDGNIQGCRLPTLPIWEIDICRTALRAGDERGTNAAEQAELKMASRMELCRRILSPFPSHPTWWSPKEPELTIHEVKAEGRGRNSIQPVTGMGEST